MKFPLLVLAVSAVAIGATPARAQDTEWLVSGDALRQPDVPFRPIRYGPASDQVFRFNLPKKKSPRPPLAVLVGDAGWRGGAASYPMHLLRSELFEDGYAFAAIDYTPAFSHDLGSAQGMLDKILTAFNKIMEDAETLGFDPARVVLLGNGAGGHFVTLLGTDPSLLGEHFDAVKGVVSVNGHGFDIPQQIEKAGEFRANEFRKVFGNNTDMQSRLSPVNHVAAPNAPAFLFQVVADLPHLQNQAMGMREILKQAGAKTAYAPLPAWKGNQGGTYYGFGRGVGYLHLSEFLAAVVPVDR